QAFIDLPESFRSVVVELTAKQADIQKTAVRAIAAAWRRQISQASRYLMAAGAAGPGEKDESKIDEIAKQNGVDAQRLRLWMKALAEVSIAAVDHPLAAWARANREGEASAEPVAVGSAWREPRPPEPDFTDWFVTGHAFGNGTPAAGQIGEV